MRSGTRAPALLWVLATTLGACVAAHAAPSRRAPVEEWPIPISAGERVSAPAPDGHGNAWLVGDGGARVLRFDGHRSIFDPFSISAAVHPRSIVTALDAVFIAGTDNGTILRLDPTSGIVHTYHIPDSTVRDPGRLAFDERARIGWFTAEGTATVGRFEVATGGFMLWHLARGARPDDIVVDSLGQPWFVARGARSLGHVDMRTRASTVLPPDDSALDPWRIAMVRDASVWVANARGALVRVDPRAGTREVFPPRAADRGIPTALASGGAVVWIAVSARDATSLLGFDTRLRHWLAPLSLVRRNSSMIVQLAADPDGRTLWFVTANGQLGRIVLPRESRESGATKDSR